MRRAGFEPYQDEKGGWHCGCEVRNGKRKGMPCKRSVLGPAACPVHGPSPGRPITTGARSKYKLNRLAARYEEALRDPELLSLRDDLAIAETLTAEAVEKFDAQEGCVQCSKARTLFQHYLAEEHAEKRKALLTALNGVLRAGAEGYAAKEEALSLQEHKRKLSETEAKRLGLMQQFVTAKELMVLFAQVALAIRETVSNQTERTRLVQRIDGLIEAGE